MQFGSQNSLDSPSAQNLVLKKFCTPGFFKIWLLKLFGHLVSTNFGPQNFLDARIFQILVLKNFWKPRQHKIWSLKVFRRPDFPKFPP